MIKMRRKILYQSTNRKLKCARITGFPKKVSFREALFMGQAPDHGLFMPTPLPKLSRQDILGLKGKAYHAVAYEVLQKFLADEIKGQTLRGFLEEAYNFEIPVEKLGRHVYLFRLDRGPTASFKDFAARFLARTIGLFKDEEEDMAVLVATSGDTGSAIGEAFKGISRIRVFVVYPKFEVSRVQEKQLQSIGQNVRAVAIDAKFDDCQTLVKKAFSDPDLKTLNLISANSINIGRVLPQIVYYFYAYSVVADGWEPVVFSVPSGNFGNSLGCEFARRLGLPVQKIIIATNENDEFPEFLKTGAYRKIMPSRKCLSNAMNVGNPSNLARYFDLYGGIVDKDGYVHRNPDLREMNRRLYSIAISDGETIHTIRRVYEQCGVIVEPHGAVGIAALNHYFQEHPERLAVCLETAHPAKFQEVIMDNLNTKPDIPPSLAKLHAEKGQSICLPNDYVRFKRFLLDGNEAGEEMEEKTNQELPVLADSA